MKKINVICTSYSGPKEIEIEPTKKAMFKIIPERYKLTCLEDGVSMVLPYKALPEGFYPYKQQRYIPVDEIHGTFIIVGYDKETGNFRSLTPAQIERYLYQIWVGKLQWKELQIDKLNNI